MVHKSLDIRKELFENPEKFMKEFKELFQNPEKFIKKREGFTRTIHTAYTNLNEMKKFLSPTKIAEVSKITESNTQKENENKQPEKKCNETQKNTIKETNEDTKSIKENPYEFPAQTQPVAKVKKIDEKKQPEKKCNETQKNTIKKTKEINKKRNIYDAIVIEKRENKRKKINNHKHETQETQSHIK